MNWISATIRIPDKPLLTIGEVAIAIDCENKAIRRWIREGTFPSPFEVGSELGERWSSLAIGVWLAWQEHKPRPAVVAAAIAAAAKNKPKTKIEDDDDETE